MMPGQCDTKPPVVFRTHISSQPGLIRGKSTSCNNTDLYLSCSVSSSDIHKNCVCMFVFKLKCAWARVRVRA